VSRVRNLEMDPPAINQVEEALVFYPLSSRLILSFSLFTFL
jgi:hypothetical protein